MTDQSLIPIDAQEIDQLQTVIDRMQQQAEKLGASAAEASASLAVGLSTSTRLGEVETLSFQRDKSVGITVYFGHKKGSATTSDTSLAALQSTVEAACHIAKYTADDEYAGLADKELMATEQPDLDLNHPWHLSPAAAIELAQACESRALADKRITNSEGATVSTRQGARVYGNSHGFRHASRSTKHSLSCVVIAGKEEAMQRDYWYSVAREQADLESAEQVADKAVARTVARLSGRQVATQKVPVIFSAELAGGLIGCFLSAIRGSSLYRKSSFLLDQLGETVFAPWVNITEDPLVLKGFASGGCDAEGVQTQARDVVSDGVLQGYLLSSYSARKLGMTTTGNAGGEHNIFMQPGDQDLKQLLSTMGTGLLITELMGQGINLVTGDYSRGASGFWVEQGEIQYPVEEITVAGNLKDMFKQLQAVGNDVDRRGHIMSGSLLIDSMMLAGQ